MSILGMNHVKFTFVVILIVFIRFYSKVMYLICILITNRLSLVMLQVAFGKRFVPWNMYAVVLLNIPLGLTKTSEDIVTG